MLDKEIINMEKNLLEIVDCALSNEIGKVFAFLAEHGVQIDSNIMKEFDNYYEKRKFSVRAEDVHFSEIYENNKKNIK